MCPDQGRTFTMSVCQETASWSGAGRLASPLVEGPKADKNTEQLGGGALCCPLEGREVSISRNELPAVCGGKQPGGTVKEKI